MSPAEPLPGDPLADAPPDWSPSGDGLPPIAAQTGTAVETALLLLESRRWWLQEFHIDHPLRETELEAIIEAIAATERALAARNAR
jgi:hypothetical protein